MRVIDEWNAYGDKNFGDAITVHGFLLLYLSELILIMILISCS